MVVRLEDYRFYTHHGVDLGAISDAWMINSSIGRTAVGGSTIPMQLARNLFLTPRKTYFRKYLEAIIAVEMVTILPKDRILELYLNYIEWGKGIFGIGAASAYYFKTGVGGLGLDELRRLATIITNPLRYDVQTFHKSAQMSQRYSYLLSRFPDPTAEPMDRGPVAPIPDAARCRAPAAERSRGRGPASSRRGLAPPPGADRVLVTLNGRRRCSPALLSVDFFSVRIAEAVERPGQRVFPRDLGAAADTQPPVTPLPVQQRRSLGAGRLVAAHLQPVSLEKPGPDRLLVSCFQVRDDVFEDVRRNLFRFH